MGRSRWRRLRHQLGAADDAASPSSPPRDWQPPADGATGGPCLCAAAPAPAANGSDTGTAATDVSKPSESASRRPDQVSEDGRRPIRLPDAADTPRSPSQVSEPPAPGRDQRTRAPSPERPPPTDGLLLAPLFATGLLLAPLFWTGLLLAPLFRTGLLLAPLFRTGLLLAPLFWTSLLQAPLFTTGILLAPLFWTGLPLAPPLGRAFC